MTTNTTNNSKVIANAIARINKSHGTVQKAQLLVGRELVKVKADMDKGFYKWLDSACHDNTIRYGATYCKNSMTVVNMVDAHGRKYAADLETIKFSTLYALASACIVEKAYRENDLKVMVEYKADLDKISETVAKVMANDIKGGMPLKDAIEKAKGATLDSLKADRKIRKADRKAEKDAEKARIKADAVKGVYELMIDGNKALITELDAVKVLLKDGNIDGAISQIDSIIGTLKGGIDNASAKVKACELKPEPKANTTK